GSGGGVEQARQQAAAETADAETRWFLGGKNQKLDAALGTKTGALESTNRFEASQHAHRSVVAAGVGDCVDVSACSTWRQGWIFPTPAGERIAGCVIAQIETGFAAEVLHVGARPDIGECVDDPRHYRRRRFRDLA